MDSKLTWEEEELVTQIEIEEKLKNKSQLPFQVPTLRGENGTRSLLGIALKAGVALLLWRILGLKEKIKFLSRHPWWTVVGIAATVQLYRTAKPYFGPARQKILQVGFRVGMKAVSLGIQYGMSFLQGGKPQTKSAHFTSSLQRYMQTQFIPMLPHIKTEIDKEVGSLLDSIASLKADMKTLSAMQKSQRISGMFQQAVVTYVSTELAFGHLYALEQFVFAVLIRSKLDQNADLCALQVVMQAVVEDIFFGQMLPFVTRTVQSAVNEECAALSITGEGGEGKELRTVISKEDFVTLLQNTRRRVNATGVSSSSDSTQKLDALCASLCSVLPESLSAVAENALASFKTSFYPTGRGHKAESAGMADGPRHGVLFESALRTHSPTAATTCAVEALWAQQDERLAAASNEADQSLQALLDAGWVRIGERPATKIKEFLHWSAPREHHAGMRHSQRRKLAQLMGQAWDLALCSSGQRITESIEKAVSESLDYALMRLAFPGQSESKGNDTKPAKLITLVVIVMRYFKSPTSLLAGDADANPFLQRLEATAQIDLAHEFHTIHWCDVE